jgi:predicted nucleic acid-binding protein
MPYYTFDTSVVVSRRVQDLPDNFLLSAVVVLELIAAARDESERKKYEALTRDYREDNSLIVPEFEDWLLASKILHWLSQDRKRKAGGKSPRAKPGATQRMALDALIAVSARRWKATVVTNNWDDFKAIQRYCNVRLIKGSKFFK